MRRTYVVVNGEVVEKMRDTIAASGVLVMPDIQPYKSMIDGSLITSRSHHREHLRAHGCIEVGNDSSLQKTQLPPIAPPPRLKETIAELVYSRLRYK